MTRRVWPAPPLRDAGVWPAQLPSGFSSAFLPVCLEAGQHPQRPRQANLAFRNLARARMVRLATGQQMATFLKSKGVNLTKLTNAQIRDGNNGADLGALTQSQRAALLKDTPLC